MLGQGLVELLFVELVERLGVTRGGKELKSS